MSQVWLHFAVSIGLCGVEVPVFVLAFKKCDVGNDCFPVSVCASVGRVVTDGPTPWVWANSMGVGPMYPLNP